MAALAVPQIRKFKLSPVLRAELPTPPSIWLGVFRRAAWPSSARTRLEVAVEALNMIDDSEDSVRSVPWICRAVR